MDGRSGGLHAHLVCHCLLIEAGSELVLVDTGYGLGDIRRPYPRLSRAMANLLNIRFREEETAIRQIEALGFDPKDVRHIVLTHLDFDHAGGLEDFPHAMVHVMEAERNAAAHRRHGVIGSRRYRPMQLDDVTHWTGYQGGGEPWFGFDSVRQLAGLPPEILMIPLPGHTWGHAGIAIAQPQGWLLHAGDAYFHADEMRTRERHCPPGLRLYQTMMEVDRTLRLENQSRLRNLSRDATAGVTMICAHDVAEFEACRVGLPLTVPA